MQTKKQKKWTSPLERLKEPTKVCKLCFKNIEDFSLFNLLNKNVDICKRCYQSIRPYFVKFVVNGYKGFSIYHYDQKIQSLLYQLKGCFDIEIANLFLERYWRELSIRFRNYLVVPIPSCREDDEIREFNHVEEIFKNLKLPMRKLIVKTKRVKQASSNLDKRKEISKYLELVEKPDLSKTKILLVDDVYTTGSTIKAAIKLLEKLHPKTIRVLVTSKTISKP